MVVLLGGAWLVWQQTDDLGAAIAKLSPGRVAASAAAALVGTVTIQRTWLALLSGLGVRTDRRDAAAMFYVTQLGKYLPGSVWPVLAQMQFGARWGVPRRLMFAANMLLLAVVAASGIAAGALLLPWSSPDGLTRYWWLLVLLVPLVVTLHPRIVPAALDRALTVVGREPVAARISARGLFTALAWSTATWVVLGAHLAVLVASYETISGAHVAAAVGGMGLAWAAGLAFIPAPAGAGVRDAVLVLTFVPLVGADAAVTIALTSRVLLLLADVVLAAWGALTRRVGWSASRPDER